MNNLSPKMQARLNNWRERLEKVVPDVKKNMKQYVRASKKDYGDAVTIEQWKQEAEKSQRRK